MNANDRPVKLTARDAQKYVGRHVVTTSNERGVVHHASPSIDGKTIVLHVTVGSYAIVTDNEHATINKTAEDVHHFRYASGGRAIPED